MILLLLVLPLVISVSAAKTQKDFQISAKGLGRHKEHGINYANFKAHKNSYLTLDKVAVKVVMVHTLKECCIACLNNYLCFSFNIAIQPDKYGHFVCENLAGDKYINSSNFISSKDFHHFSIATPCLNKPCRNGARCFPRRYQADTYTCVCVPGYTGLHCQTDIDECASNPCNNSGTCHDLVNDYNCSCTNNWYGKNCHLRAKDCRALKNFGVKTKGSYSIYPDDSGPMRVYCDMVTDGGGWTVIQRRIDGSVDFYLGWDSYKRGFGNLSGEFWLGNDNIHRLTASGNTVLRVEVEDWSNNAVYAVYGTFKVDSESNKYKLTVGSYSGTAGDSLDYHDGMYFTTKDRDNDYEFFFSCAKSSTGAWWYKNCRYSNLNGRYIGNREDEWKGIVWYYWKDDRISMKRSVMMIRSP